MKITNMEKVSKNIPSVGDIIIFHPKSGDSSLVRMLIAWDDEQVVLLDPKDADVTTSIYDSFTDLYYDCLHSFYPTYTVIDNSRLELIIHN